jgi:hypothetical protein
VTIRTPKLYSLVAPIGARGFNLRHCGRSHKAFMRFFHIRGTTKPLLPVVFSALTFMLSPFGQPALSLAADYPQSEITNGIITAKLYLPNAKNGYYRSTRFDWSGAIYSLNYQGHTFYEPWFDSVDPKVINFAFRGSQIVNGSCGALEGPAYEFQTPLDWDSAKPGGKFLKIGVGVLRKTDGTYNRFFPYEILDPGRWTVKKHKDRIEFQQVLSDPAMGYSYVYRKVVRLVRGKPELVIESSLKNTGRREIKSDVYAHNFTTIDHQPPGPDYMVSVPFQIQPGGEGNRQLAEARGNDIVFNKVLNGEDQAVVFLRGFSDSVTDNRITIVNNKVGAGVRFSGNRPLLRVFLWSIRTVIAVEAYVAIDIPPGADFTWSNTYNYYTLPSVQ